MEYVEGADFRKYLKRLGRPVQAQELESLIKPVMEAVSRAHEIKLIHRDISPDNIMVMPNGETKLLDFGAARYVENPDADGVLKSSTQAILKHGFAPPEQYQSRGALGPWTDVYAMCATIYYCMTGAIPPESMSRVLEGTQIDWSKLNGLSRRQLDALKKGMELQPKDRFDSMKALCLALFPEPVAVAAPVRKSGKRKKDMLWLVAAILALTVGASTVLARSYREPAGEDMKTSAVNGNDARAGTTAAEQPEARNNMAEALPSTENRRDDAGQQSGEEDFEEAVRQDAGKDTQSDGTSQAPTSPAPTSPAPTSSASSQPAETYPNTPTETQPTPTESQPAPTESEAPTETEAPPVIVEPEMPTEPEFDDCPVVVVPGGMGGIGDCVVAKPVIYLYPREESAVTVKLDYDGILTTTYPVYRDRWEVIARPDGTLTLPGSDREYYCLFWEGINGPEYDWDRGFVVKGEETAAFLERTLRKLGLTDREADEFIIYWLPLMEGNAYNLITFQQSCYTDYARLHITPEPDSILRVFMAWKPLEEPIAIEEQELPTFHRTGFAVVEWGGEKVTDQ